MLSFTLKLSRKKITELENQTSKAERKGDLGEIKRLLALLSLSKGKAMKEIAEILKMNQETIRQILHRYLVGGLRGVVSKSRPGRPPKLTKVQRKELWKWIKSGPEAMGFLGACWRTPMIQWLIKERFNVFYNVHYISELLKNMGFSFQKATFIADKQDEEKRREWLEKTWPEIREVADKKNAYILFGDEASFPQWGTLSYTWAPRGQQPVIQTSGNRRGYKVFGLIDYFTGRFFSKGHEGKLNSESYIAFLLEVLAKTRKHIILIQDNAPYHRGKKVTDFFNAHADRITIYKLPSYSPDFNPIEKLWKKIKQTGTHLKYFPTFDDLKNTVNDMLVHFENVGREVLTLFGFYNDLDIVK